MKAVSIFKLLNELKFKNDFIFLETKRIGKKDNRSFLFTDPHKVICCMDSSQLKVSLDDIETWVRKGYYAAGYIAYEAGFCFEPALFSKIRPCKFPLIWFGIYKNPVIFNHKKIFFNNGYSKHNYSLDNLCFNLEEDEYIKAINEIKKQIENGYTYQVNYTFKEKFSFTGDVIDCYLDIRANQSVAYSSFLKADNRFVLSFSPELFFRRDKRCIEVMPMKGTEKRGRNLAEDKKNIDSLSQSIKNRSENVMIVDLLRNDLGRICVKDTVKTKSLFNVQCFESVLQMTSTVEGKLRRELSMYDFFKAIFPSGSVTGAPKIETMNIIDNLEKEQRDIYTGAIGYISPSDKWVFNVAIRTVIIDENSGSGEMGIGSGVVYDSDALNEYEECKLKAEFLKKRQEFKLLETMLWNKDKKFWLLDIHLERLSESAEYFNFRYNKKQIIDALSKEEKKFNKKKNYRVRFLLSCEGDIETAASILDYKAAPNKVKFSDKRVNSSDIFLFHKTTNRVLYNNEYKKASEEGFFDTIFLNEKNEVTEGAISNIFIEKNGKYYTPPIECGLLNGVYRRYLLKSNVFPVEEKVLYREDIQNAGKIFLTNAVKGMVKVLIQPDGQNYE